MEKVTALRPTALFGTPPEPLFNNQLCGATTEMLEDWMVLLADKNSEALENAKAVQGSSIIQESVQFLFLTCDRMKMSSEVKYLSLDLFDRFMLQHVQDLHEHVVNTHPVKTRMKEWQEIQKRVSNQVVLRVISCIQIASKLTSHYRILSPNKARRFLFDAGHRYNTESILQSELRILKTLDFCVSRPSPLVYLECILEALGKTECEFEVKVLHGVTLNLLDMVYLQYSEIYSRLHEVAAGGSPVTQKDMECFASVRADKMLLMVTLITAAAYIIDRNSHEKIMFSVSRITKIPAEDISDFASVILKTLMESSED
ncbi:cyclin N-terminal domain-containing protein 1-like [Ruditapes philippinarum]|uniref:cyclin N-terminal domain-containing protein 1-like n=1 Tax=Ruditapes philippinarum TaxID=129788 RepID=UPI00295B4996|nr:cyclin N-terminal domain-containing protein 1-like [Ruditapes philippinarum]